MTVGVVENAQFRGRAIYGDIRLRRQSEHFEALVEAAESFDGFFGMSHIADGETHYDRASGEEVVEAIKEVFSVDIVTEPATAAGLFEDVGGIDDDVDDWGIPILKPIAPKKGGMGLDPADFWDVISDAENVLSDAHEVLGGGYDAQPTRALLAKHGKALAKVVGQSVIDELTTLASGQSPEPVAESFRSLLPRQHTPEQLTNFANRLR